MNFIVMFYKEFQFNLLGMIVIKIQFIKILYQIFYRFM